MLQRKRSLEYIAQDRELQSLEIITVENLKSHIENLKIGIQNSIRTLINEFLVDRILLAFKDVEQNKKSFRNEVLTHYFYIPKKESENLTDLLDEAYILRKKALELSASTRAIDLSIEEILKQLRTFPNILRLHLELLEDPDLELFVENFSEALMPYNPKDTPFNILNVTRNSTDAEVRKGFIRAHRILVPLSIAGDRSADVALGIYGNAYATLKTQEKRNAEYLRLSLKRKRIKFRDQAKANGLIISGGVTAALASFFNTDFMEPYTAALSGATAGFLSSMLFYGIDIDWLDKLFPLVSRKRSVVASTTSAVLRAGIAIGCIEALKYLVAK